MKTAAIVNFLTLFLLRGVLFSQNQIIGKVVNEKAEPIAFANVLLFKAIDSSFVKGQVAQDELKTQNPSLKTQNRTPQYKRQKAAISL